MKLAILAAASIPALASAKSTTVDALQKMADRLPASDIAAKSKTGGRILSKARRLDGNDGDTTWVAGYSLKFHSCVSSQDYYGGYFADNEQNGANNYYYNDNQNNGQNGEYDANAYGNGNGYYNNEQRNDYQGMYEQKLVHFKLCPSNSCWSCKNGADYVVELSEYVNAVLEAKMSALEYNCEHVRENCWCENANNKDNCLYTCFGNAGMPECQERMYENNNDEFDVQEAIECSQLDVDKDAIQSYYFNNRQANQANYYQNGENQNQNMEKLYVGPYCSANGKSIHLGLFHEETCSVKAPADIYAAINYGKELPYAKKSLVDSGCISCKEPKEVDYQNYWDQQDADEVTDVCENLYATAGKCEENLDGYFPYRDNYGCSFIKNLPKQGVLSGVKNVNITAKVFAGIFGVTTALLAALSFVLFKRDRRQNISLTSGDVIA